MLKTECPAARQINSILEQNGYINGNNRIAWAQINEQVKNGTTSAWRVYKYGSDTNHSVEFPCGQVGKSIKIQIAYNEIQDRLCGGCENWGITSPDEIWNEIEVLVRLGQFTAEDIYYFGALEHYLLTSTLADGDGDC